MCAIWCCLNHFECMQHTHTWLQVIGRVHKSGASAAEAMGNMTAGGMQVICVCAFVCGYVYWTCSSELISVSVPVLSLSLSLSLFLFVSLGMLVICVQVHASACILNSCVPSWKLNSCALFFSNAPLFFLAESGTGRSECRNWIVLDGTGQSWPVHVSITGQWCTGRWSVVGKICGNKRAVHCQSLFWRQVWMCVSESTGGGV